MGRDCLLWGNMIFLIILALEGHSPPDISPQTSVFPHLSSLHATPFCFFLTTIVNELFVMKSWFLPEYLEELSTASLCSFWAPLINFLNGLCCREYGVYFIHLEWPVNIHRWPHCGDPAFCLPILTWPWPLSLCPFQRTTHVTICPVGQARNATWTARAKLPASVPPTANLSCGRCVARMARPTITSASCCVMRASPALMSLSNTLARVVSISVVSHGPELQQYWHDMSPLFKWFHACIIHEL